MKLERMLAIINILTERGKVTAPELAQMLEVSKRTINRDIDSLCLAGVPIVTTQGYNGGVYLMEGYTFDKRILKEDELSDIVAGLKGVTSIQKNQTGHLLLQKRLSGASDFLSIDLASHYADSLSSKTEILKLAAMNHQSVIFDYYSPKGKTLRTVNPYRMLYRWSYWYLLGWCNESKDFRFFKLNRLWELKLTDIKFEPLMITDDNLLMGTHMVDDQPFEVMFSKSVEYQIIESYGPSSYVHTKEGLHFKGQYSNIGYIISWILSFGKDAKVIGPDELTRAVEEQRG